MVTPSAVIASTSAVARLIRSSPACRSGSNVRAIA
jgi:hypothetical protein